MGQGHCFVQLTRDSETCKWIQLGTAAWMPSSMWCVMGLCFKAFLALDCQLSRYLVFWRAQAEGMYQTGKLPSDLLQTYCQLLAPPVPVPAVMGGCHSLRLFGSHVYSDSYRWGKSIMPREGGIQRHGFIVWEWKMEWGVKRGKMQALWITGRENPPLFASAPASTLYSKLPNTE